MIAGFAFSNPMAVMTMVDTSRWRPVVYAMTPETTRRYKDWKASSKTDGRKNVLFLFGVTALRDVYQDHPLFSTICIFDELQNLTEASGQISGMSVVDIIDVGGIPHPKHLTPQDVADVLSRPGSLPENLLLKRIQSSLGVRRPSVLETTNRVPGPLDISESGVQKVFLSLKEAVDHDLFNVALNTYCKFLFRIVDRNTVTQTVTKKLPSEVKETWKSLLDYAESGIGLSMARAYRDLSSSNDPDFRHGHAVAKHDLRNYAGDFMYFTSVLPPSGNWVFLPTLNEDTATTANFWKAPPAQEANKPRGRKTKNKS